MKMHCFFRDLLYSQARIGQTEGMVMMSMARSTELWISWPSGRGFCAGAWPDRSYSENALFLCESFLRLGMDWAKRKYSNDGRGGGRRQV